MGVDLNTYRSRIGVFPNRGQTRKRRRREGGKLTKYGRGLRKNILRTLTILGVGLVLHVHTMQTLNLSGDIETNPGPGSDNGKSISWDDSKCVGESRSTPTRPPTWLFRQEEDKKELKQREERDKKAEDETKKNKKMEDHEKNAKKREAGFTSQDRSLERESKEAEEESKSQQAEWVQPDSYVDDWTNQGMFGVFGAMSNAWEEAKERERKKKEKEKKEREKIKEYWEKYSKFLKREKEEEARKIKKSNEEKERAKQLDKPPSTSNNPEPDHEVSQSRFDHPLLMQFISGESCIIWFIGRS